MSQQIHSQSRMNPSNPQNRERNLFHRIGNESPSIGRPGLEFDRINNRIRGIVPELITEPARFTKIMQDAYEMGHDHRTSRVAVRFFVPLPRTEGQSHPYQGVMQEVLRFSGRRTGEYNNLLEGVVPFIHGQQRYGVVYAAMNKDERLSPFATVEKERRAIADMQARDTVQHRPRNYEIRDARMEDVEALTGLYKGVFSKYPVVLNASTIANIVNGMPMVVAVSRNDGNVASALAAEHVSFEVGGLGGINMIELSEAATHNAHRRRGLTSVLAEHLVRSARSELGEDGLVMYAEAVPSPAATKAFLNANGRYGGTVHQQCVIRSDNMLPESKESQYGNLSIIYYTGHNGVGPLAQA